MEHKCFNCGHFDAFYTKGYCCFLRTDCGFCSKFKQTKQKQCCCENWRSKYYPKFKRSAVLHGLEEALTKLNSINLILDERSENKTIFDD